MGIAMTGVFAPGAICGGYRIRSLISEGGMGEVYEAVHEFTQRPVALKCLQLRHANRDDLRERMRLEAIVLCQIQHPNVVMVYDAGATDNGVVWIAMERLHGRTLREILCSPGRIPVRDALTLGCSMAKGVGAAHALGVVHRDLKPENVFATDKGEIKVLDLGTAKFYGLGLKNTDRLRTVGTPAYMAPEHLRGQAVDGRADVYSLALIVYEMISGHHAFANAADLSDVYAMGALQLHGDVPPLTMLVPECPSQAWQALSKALAKNRDDRYASMGEFEAAMQAALENASGATPDGRPVMRSAARIETEVLPEDALASFNADLSDSPAFRQSRAAVPRLEPGAVPSNQIGTLGPTVSKSFQVDYSKLTFSQAALMGVITGVAFMVVSFVGWRLVRPHEQVSLLRAGGRVSRAVLVAQASATENAPPSPPAVPQLTASVPSEEPPAPPGPSVDEKVTETEPRPTETSPTPTKPDSPVVPNKPVTNQPLPRRTRKSLDLGAPKF